MDPGTTDDEAHDRHDVSVVDALSAVEAAVDMVASVDLTSLSATEQLAVMERLDRAGRRLDHQNDRLAGHVDRTGAYGVDGHRSAKAAAKARCRVSGAVAQARIRNARILRDMPVVERTTAGGDIPSESVRAMSRTLSNPRVRDFAPLVDEIFAEQAASQTPEDFQAWLRDWERLADPDGVERRAEAGHARRHVSLLESAIDSSWTLRGGFGALQGAAMAEILARFEDAEFARDWTEAKAVHGDETRVEHLARTPAQRRADALFAIFRAAAAAPEGSREPKPLVNIVIDEETFREALQGAAGGRPAAPDPTDVERRRCQTVAGTRLAPSEVVGAALHGHVRRVVVDGASTVIDLGRRRRLFTGAARDAVFLQAVLRTRGRLSCGYVGCDAPSHRLQADHDDEWFDHGRTDVTNGRVYCGAHNVLKHQLARSGRDPGDLWRVRRPE